MKKILIYGDSNVWGDNFFTGVRIPDDKQWVNILKDKIGGEYILLQEGLPGRVAGSLEEYKKYKNGKDTFMSIFRTSAPVDKVIIALGTNDLQLKYNRNSNEIINDILWYKQVVSELYEDEEDRKKFFVNETMPEYIFVLPINFDYNGGAEGIFDANSENIRQEIITYFKENINDKFIYENDMNLFEDGIHLNFDGHSKMADIVSGVLVNGENKES